jgi:hypothetical protein
LTVPRPADLPLLAQATLPLARLRAKRARSEGALDLVARRAFLAGDLGMRAATRPREEVPPEAVVTRCRGLKLGGAAR